MSPSTSTFDSSDRALLFERADLFPPEAELEQHLDLLAAAVRDFCERVKGACLRIAYDVGNRVDGRPHQLVTVEALTPLRAGLGREHRVEERDQLGAPLRACEDVRECHEG